MIGRITIDGKEVKFLAKLSVIRDYKNTYGTDFMVDLDKVSASYKNDGVLEASVLVVAAQIAHTMAKRVNPDIPDDALDWTDTFEAFPIGDIFPQLMELWIKSSITSVTPKNAVGAGR